MVTAFAQLLSREYRGKLDAKADQYIDFAVKGSRQMETLLSDLRQYWAVDEARIEKLGAIDCNHVFDRALSLLETAVGEGAAVITRDELPTVWGEEYPLVLLFQNLLGNAIKYHRPDVPPRIHVSASPFEDGWKFSITDNGIGIESDKLEAVFQPFKRLHGSRYPGSGLGLAMCRRVVARYQGRIWIESEADRGTTIFFTLAGSK